MTGLRRSTPARPVRVVHLGLGSFSRAHQAWYTDRSSDAADWGIAAFTGRRPDLADALAAQDGLYTLVTRGAEDDAFTTIRSLSRTLPGGDHGAWLDAVAAPDVRVLTTTVTEAGYLRAAGGGLDHGHPSAARDIVALRDDPRAPVTSAPARVVAGLIARRAAGGGPMTLVPCDNLPDNGPALARVVRDMTQAVDPSLIDWLDSQVSTATTMVDRITPAPTAADGAAVRAGTGHEDRCPVVTEPFSEWVVAGDFPGGRPAWETAGAVFTDDVTPYEQRKLWLLNGAHSLLAYVGSQRGRTTVDEAVGDRYCAELLHQWWSLCTPHLSLGPEQAASYCTALLERFTNPRMRHALAQIATDGSQKLPIRLLPVLRAERLAGRLPDVVVTVLAAWLVHLRDAGSPLRDVRADDLRARANHPDPDAVPAVLAALDPSLADDSELVVAIRQQLLERALHR